MSETDLWDGNVPTRKKFMGRTFAWGTTNPDRWIEDLWFINTTDDELLKYDGEMFKRIFVNKKTLQLHSVII